MPLRKLWKSICGHSKPAVSAKEAAADPTTVTGPAPAAGASHDTVRHAASPQTAAVPVDAPAPRRKPAATVTREHKKLCRRIESMGVQSVLEIGIGDGRRGLSVVSHLTHKGHSTPVHYIAVDEFEMGSSPVSLRDFHKQLREFPAKVHLVPMDVDAGLDRVVRTYGQVDLIIWDQPEPPTPLQSAFLNRLSKPATRVLTQENGQWAETLAATLAPISGRQAA